MAASSRDDDLATLRAKLTASQTMGVGYKDRIKAIQARIDELEAQNG